MAKIDFKKKYLTAFKLYLLGEDIQKIAQKCNVNKLTIYRWIERNHWKEQQTKQLRELEERVYLNVTEEKERSLILIKAAENVWVKKLQEGLLEPKFSDLAALQRAKMEILMPKTIAQYNFVKNEQNMGPKYSIEIIDSDDDKDKMETDKATENSLQIS